MPMASHAALREAFFAYQQATIRHSFHPTKQGAWALGVGNLRVGALTGWVHFEKGYRRIATHLPFHGAPGFGPTHRNPCQGRL